MRNLSFFAVGIYFGIILTKSEAISWFRILEMFRFESIHMYGILGTAVIFGALIIWAMKKFKMKTLKDTFVSYRSMELRIPRHILAGSIFGLGWALVGCCPGPMYILLGHGYWIIGLVMLGALLGTFVYGAFGSRLPH